MPTPQSVAAATGAWPLSSATRKVRDVVTLSGHVPEAVGPGQRQLSGRALSMVSTHPLPVPPIHGSCQRSGALGTKRNATLTDAGGQAKFDRGTRQSHDRT